MSQALSRIQTRLVLITTISFALTPIIGYVVASLFGIVDLSTLLTTTTGLYITVTYLALLVWVRWHFSRFTKPVVDWHLDHPNGQQLPESLSAHLGGFTTNYWSFYLIAVLALPTIQHLGGLVAIDSEHTSSLLHAMLLQLVIAIFVGMPGYLLSLSTLGQLSSYVGLSGVQVSIKTKMLIIGAYLPVLTTALLLEYFWWRMAYVEAEILLGWGLISLAAFVITAVAIKGLQQSLRPVTRRTKILTLKGLR